LLFDGKSIRKEKGWGKEKNRVEEQGAGSFNKKGA
jgi:hypothetical protein